MQRYIAQRIILAIPTIFAVTIVTFFGLRLLLPTSAVDIILEEAGRRDPALEAQVRHELGLDDNLVVQYLKWLGDIVSGDLGSSIHSRRSVAAELQQRVPISLELGLWGLFSSLALSVPLGVWAAVKQDKFPDYGLRSLAVFIDAVPSFWLAVLVLTLGFVWFGWTPPIEFRTLTADPLEHLKAMAAPALIIGLTPSGGLIRLVRTQMLEVLRQDYVRTAHAKGLPARTVLFRHALRNALLPVITVIGVSLPGVIAGTVILEQIFSIPGMGRYTLGAIGSLDYPVIQATNLILALILVFAVIVVDVSYSIIDPRVRLA